jgi:predicted MFS family arabinose efflux permease
MAGRLVASAYVAFAAFGSFWGVWGASVPRVQAQAGVDDGELGIALLFVGAGALPAMLLAGRALDRWGLRVGGGVIALLGVVAGGLGLGARDLASLCAALAVAGAVSGAADVAINAIAGRAEKVAGRPVITRAHGTFSSFVVLCSLATGLAAGAGAPLAAPFVAVAALLIAAGAAMARALPAGIAPEPHEATTSRAPMPLVPLLLVGVLGALAFASENAHQSWSAVFAHDELDAHAALTSVAPAVFAATVAVTRFAFGGLGPRHARAVILAGAAGAGAGALIIAGAPNLLIAALGLVVAGAGTAVLFPTIVGIVSRNVDEARRGRAMSVVTVVSYMGFLLGPVYVGLWADATGLRGAMVAVAALAAALFLLAPALLRLSGFDRAAPRGASARAPASARTE